MQIVFFLQGDSLVRIRWLPVVREGKTIMLNNLYTVCPTVAYATVYVHQEQIQRYTVCPTGADATVYVQQEQMQRYMSDSSRSNGICPTGADATVLYVQFLC